MSTTDTERTDSLSDSKQYQSIQRYVRVGGALYLYIIFAGIFAEVFVRSQLVVSGDTSATAANILASEFLFRAGLSAELLMLICDVSLALIFFLVLRPVSFLLALFAASLRLVMVAVSSANLLNHMDALLWLNGTSGLEVLGSNEVQALAYHSLRSHAFGYHLALVFFGFYCVTLGALIVRSEVLPKLLGYLLIMAGVCYLTNSFGSILAVEAISKIGPAILLPALVAELSLALWMLIKGINIEKWRMLQRAMPGGLDEARA